MRSVVVRTFGDPRQVLTLREGAELQPGPGEVRLQLILSPIHTHDLEIIRGEYGQKFEMPMTPGTEAVARIDLLGHGVNHLQIGQRVCVAGVSGAWAEHFIAPASKIVPLPDEVPDEAACQLLAMPLSASILFEDLVVQPDEWIVQNTANGAIGRVINALARKRGVHVVNLVRSGAAMQAMRDAGYDHVVATDQSDWQAQVAKIVCGAPILRAIDSLGGDAPNQLLGVLDEGGTLVSFGSMNSLMLNVHVENLLYKQATIRGFWAAKRSESITAADRARLIGEIVKMVKSGDLALTLEASYDLCDAAEAAAAVGRQNRAGKIALRA